MDYLAAVIPALFLFYLWVIVVLVCSGVLWIGFRLFRLNQRALFISVVPFAAGSFRAIAWMITPFLVVVGIWVALQNPGWTKPLQHPSARAYELGEYLFCIVFFFFASVYVPWSYGVSTVAKLQETNETQRLAIQMIRFFGATFILSVMTIYRGPLCWLIVLLILIYTFGVSGMMLYNVGVNRFLAAPQVEFKSVKPAGPLVFLQVSDIHVTAHESGVPTGGGHSGLKDLRRIKIAMTKGDIPVKLVIVSGDLVDRGDEKEWKLAMPALGDLRAQGASVILGPGNHDLLPSYSPGRHFWAAIRPGVPRPVIEGEQVRRYLDAAAELEPRLTTWDGVTLQSYVQASDEPWRRVVAVWDAAREEIIRDLHLSEQTDHVTAFKKSKWRQPEKHAQIEARFIANATKVYPELVDYWKVNLYVINPKTVEEFFRHDPWHNKWYDPYPLRATLDTPHGMAEVLVVNSSPRDPLFAQSSLGLTGVEQIERLGNLLDASMAELVVVVHHHSFARWENETFEFERWGILSHDTKESHQLFDLLKSKAREGRDIVVMTGHTHGASRSGFVPANEGASYGFWYLESAALGEKGGEVMLAGALDSAGRFHAGLMRQQFH